MTQPIRVEKRDEHGKLQWTYEGTLIARSETHVQLEAIFRREDYVADYHTFRQGDRMVEWFFADRWYNVFEMYDVEDQRLKGWYCNITRPAKLYADCVSADDLALDVMIYPDGQYRLLDEDEFAALDIDDQTRQLAQQGLAHLMRLLEMRQEMFVAIARAY